MSESKISITVTPERGGLIEEIKEQIKEGEFEDSGIVNTRVRMFAFGTPELIVSFEGSTEEILEQLENVEGVSDFEVGSDPEDGDIDEECLY